MHIEPHPHADGDDKRGNLEHPAWCDPTRCEAGPDDDMLAEHRSALVSIPTRSLDDEGGFSVTAWLTQSAWPEDYVVTPVTFLVLRWAEIDRHGEVSDASTLSLSATREAVLLHRGIGELLAKAGHHG